MKGLLSQIEVIEENGLIFILFKNNKAAAIFRNISASGDISIPRTITHNSEEYFVMSIIQSAFKNSKDIESIQFSEDSELRLIEIDSISIPDHVTEIGDYAFKRSNLVKVSFSSKSELKTIGKGVFYDSFVSTLFLPSSVVEFKEGWCDEVSFLSTIRIMKNEIENICLVDNMFLVGKSNLESENYDVLLFARRDILKAVIPPYIRIISPYAFDHSHLKKIKFTQNSELQVIGKNSFFHCQIERISFPPSLKVIDDYAFFNCDQLSMAEFTVDSLLTTIGNESFCDTPFIDIMIPSKVVELRDRFCAGKQSLTNVAIMPSNRHFSYLDNSFIVGESDPESSIFDVLLFARRDIEEATIPSFIKRIGSFAFAHCFLLKEITFSEDSQL